MVADPASCAPILGGGGRCRATPMRDVTFCFFHNPETARVRDLRRLLEIAAFDAIGLDNCGPRSGSTRRAPTRSAHAGLYRGDVPTDLDIDAIRADYGKAMRAWHVAWIARLEWHRDHFYPLADREQDLVYDHVIAEREELRAAEERAYERFLAARDVLAEALRTLGDG